MKYKKELETAKTLARRAGDIMLEYFDGNQELEHKSEDIGSSEITIADKKINRLVIEELSKKFDDGIIGEEESTSDYGPGRKWICDPIDGTKAFVIGIPVAMFSLALVIDGKPVLGVAYNPFLDKLYWAVKGQGSFCNQNRLTVSKNGLKDSYVEVTSTMERVIKNPHIVENLLDRGARVDTVYGAVFKSCLVAEGRVIGYLEESPQPHDIAAVHIIVEEAGGEVTGYEGKELDYRKFFRGAIVSNKAAHSELLASTRK